MAYFHNTSVDVTLNTVALGTGLISVGHGPVTYGSAEVLNGVVPPSTYIITPCISYALPAPGAASNV